MQKSNSLSVENEKKNYAILCYCLHGGVFLFLLWESPLSSGNLQGLAVACFRTCYSWKLIPSYLLSPAGLSSIKTFTIVISRGFRSDIGKLFKRRISNTKVNGVNKIALYALSLN